MAYARVKSDFSIISLNQRMTKGSETKTNHSQNIRGHSAVKISTDSAQHNRTIFALLGQQFDGVFYVGVISTKMVKISEIETIYNA